MPETDLLDPPKQAHSNVAFIDTPPKRPDAAGSLVCAVARLYWMLVGNAALYLAAVGITIGSDERAWTADAVFWAAVASLVLVRYVDITRLRGLTGSGEPASVGDWYRYVGRLFLVSVTVWILAHAVRRIAPG